MIEVSITEDMCDRAGQKSKEMGTLRNSITGGIGNMVGFLGEEVANMVIKGEITNTYEYDITSVENGGTITWDAKSKRCTSEPQDYYDCSVAAFNTDQACDRYVFVRIEYVGGEWGRAWVLGHYDKELYFEDSRFLKAGDADGDNGFIVKSDCYNIQIDMLNKFDGDDTCVI